MAHRRLVVGVALWLSCHCGESAYGQAWVRSRGGIYTKVSGSFLHTTQAFDYLGNRQDLFAEDVTRTDTAFREIAFSGYIEYGLLERLTVVASVPVKISRTLETLTPIAGAMPQRAIRTNYGFGDLTLSGRFPLSRGGFVSALQVGIKVPLGYEQKPENEGPPLGTGEVDGEFHLTVGGSLPGTHAYVSGGGGYRIRGGELNDEVLFNAEAGYWIDAVFLKLRFDGLVNTVDPPDIAGRTVVTPFPGGGLNEVIEGDQDIFKLSGEIGVPLSANAGVQAEVRHVLAGKNTVTGTTFVLALVYTR